MSAPLKMEYGTQPFQSPCLLSIIDDLNGKLFTPTKYHTHHGEASSQVNSFKIELHYHPESEGETEKAKLWQLVDDPDWRDEVGEDQLGYIKESIDTAYCGWKDWIQTSEFADQYLGLVDSLHSATLKTLPKIVPEFESPEQIRVRQELEEVFDPDLHSKLGIRDFDEFRECEPYEYRKRVKQVIAYHLEMVELIRKHSGVKQADTWPRSWMENNKSIKDNLGKKSQFIPILNYLTNYALHRDAPDTQRFSPYILQGQEYDHIVTKVNAEKMAEALNVSKDIIYRYVRAMRTAGFIHRLTNPYYALGYWSHMQSRIFFLTNTAENRRKLIEFSVR